MAESPSIPADTAESEAEHASDELPEVRRGIVRPVDGRIIAGVARGLADAWGWNPWVVRGLFVVTSLLAGLGIVLYALGWLLIPQAGTSRSIAAQIVTGMGLTRQWVGFGAVLVGGLIVGGMANIDFGVLLAAALLVTGYLLYRGDLTTEPEPDEPAYVYRATERHRPTRAPSYLGRLTLGVMISVLGVMAALDALDVTQPTSRHYAAAAVLVIGLGLLVGSLFGRARALLVLGVLLLPILAVAAVADYRFGGTWDTITVRPDSVESLAPAYSIDAGSLSIDLSQVELDGRTVELDLDVGVGDIFVQLPRDAALDATANAVYGSIGIDNGYSRGLGSSVTQSIPGDAGRVVIDADIRLGNINVHRYFEGEHVRPVEDLFGQSELGPLVPEGYVEIPGLSYIEPRSIRRMAGTYNVLGGQLVLDLTGIRNDEAAVSFTITGHGSARILVSPSAHLIAASSLPFTHEPDGVPGPDGWYLWEHDGDGPTFAVFAEGVHVLIEEG